MDRRAVKKGPVHNQQKLFMGSILGLKFFRKYEMISHISPSKPA